MVAVLLIGGIGLLLAGLLTVGLGIQLDLSFGNTLILAGAVVACTGVIMLGLWIALRELKALARQLGLGMPAQSRAGNMLQPGDLNAAPAPEDGGFLPALENPGNAESAAPVAIAAAMARGGRLARSRAGRARGGPCGQAAAQSRVFLVIAKGARARPGARDRSVRA